LGAEERHAVRDPSQDLVRRFPLLGSSHFRITSATSGDYNCVSWVNGDTSLWISPDEFELYWWPDGVPREHTLEAWIKVLGTFGFETCVSSSLEEGIEKVAIYALEGVGFMHVARQLASGKWTSKLGPLEDIEHDLMALVGIRYGEVVRLMQRRRAE
jgi:hypothetical protein